MFSELSWYASAKNCAFCMKHATKSGCFCGIFSGIGRLCHARRGICEARSGRGYPQKYSPGTKSHFFWMRLNSEKLKNPRKTKKTRGMIFWLSFWGVCRGCEGGLSFWKGFIHPETVEAFWGPLWRRDDLSGKNRDGIIHLSGNQGGIFHFGNWGVILLWHTRSIAWYSSGILLGNTPAIAMTMPAQPQ